jgi:hypothetical protein
MIVDSYEAKIVTNCLTAIFFVAFLACTVFKVWHGVAQKQRVWRELPNSKVHKRMILVNAAYAVSWIGMMVSLLIGIYGRS